MVGASMYEAVPITQEDVQVATAYQNKVLALVSGTPNYTGVNSPTRFTVGAICEVAFGRYLTGRGIEFTATSNDRGVPDSGDFEIRKAGFRWRVDVKGSDSPNARHLMVPLAQWERRAKAYDIFVAARYRHPEVHLMGWIPTWEFIELAQPPVELHVPTLRLAYERLNPMHKLFAPKGE